MRFTLNIGPTYNEAMQTGDHLAAALEAVAAKIGYRYDGMELPDDEGPIIDANGNTVGTWKIEAG